MTDITSFRAYEYWNQLLLNEGLPSLPIMMTEGGWETDDGIDDFYPQPTAVVASSLNLQMFRFLQGDIDMEIYKPGRLHGKFSRARLSLLADAVAHGGT